MKRLFGLFFVVSLLLIVGCQTESGMELGISSGDETDAVGSPQVYQVAVDSIGFMPATVEVQKGDTVEWINKGEWDYLLVFDDGQFSASLPAGTMVSHTFVAEGNFHYVARYDNEKSDERKDANEEIVQGTAEGIVIVN